MWQTRWPRAIAGLGVLLTLLLVGLAQWEAQARVGGGRSLGSRGSRSYRQPVRPYQPMQPAQTRPLAGREQAPSPLGSLSQPRPAFGGFMSGLAGGLLGGVLGGMLFRGLGFGGLGGGGFGGGIGLFELLLMAGIAYVIYLMVKRSRQKAAASVPYQDAFRGVEARSIELDRGTAVSAFPVADGVEADRERGLSYVRQMDPGFDEERFKEIAMDQFFRLQAAWAGRDLTPVRGNLSEGLYRTLSEEIAQLKAQGRVNRLENIAVRSTEVTEAWQEGGQDYITVRFLANLLDYTVDERSGDLLSGSRTDPVKFEEYWSFTRPVGNRPWQLSAIDQAG